jgi:hypothetical protein
LPSKLEALGSLSSAKNNAHKHKTTKQASKQNPTKQTKPNPSGLKTDLFRED